MKQERTALLVLAGALAATAALAQPAPQPGTPRVRTNVVGASTPAKVTLSMRGADAKPFLAVQATSANVRDTLNDMATKAGLKVVLDQSAVGTVSGVVDAQPAEAAITAVAKLAGLSVKKFVVPEASAATVTPQFAGTYSEALTGLPVGALVSDPATGKSLVVSAAAPAQPAGQVIYFVHGTLVPGGARMRMQRNNPGGPGGQPGGPGGQPGGPGAQPSQANQAFVDATAKNLQQMSLQQRFDTLRALQMQMFQSLTPEEQDQLRQMGGGRGFGGFGGGRRGGGNNGGGGNNNG